MAAKACAIIISYLGLLVFSIAFLYLLAALQRHVDYFVPYFAYLGYHPMESFLFTQLFVIITVIYTLIVQIHYVWVKETLKNRRIFPAGQRANLASAVFGYLSALALFFMACFQEGYAFPMNVLMEATYMICSQLYFLLLTVISKVLDDDKMVARAILNFLMLFFFVLFWAGYIVAAASFNKNWSQRHRRAVTDGGWVVYILSATCEWVLITLFQVYILTFVPDFKSVRITKKSIDVLF